MARCVDAESHRAPAGTSMTGELFKRTSRFGEGWGGRGKVTWKHVSCGVACLSRLITRNASTGRFVVIHTTKLVTEISRAPGANYYDRALRTLSRALISAPTLSFSRIVPMGSLPRGSRSWNAKSKRKGEKEGDVYITPVSTRTCASIIYYILSLWPGVMHIPRIYMVAFS